MKGRRSRREGSRGARCEGKRAAHARRRFTAKQLHGAKRRFTCRQARFTQKNVLLSGDKSTFFRGAGGGGRTRTVVMPRDFKSTSLKIFLKALKILAFLKIRNFFLKKT